MEELFAASSLVDDDALSANFIDADGLVRDDGAAEHDAAKGESSACGREGEGRGDKIAEQTLLPHLFATHVEPADLLHGLAATAAEGDELTATYKDGNGRASGVEGGELVDLPGERMEVEGPMRASLVDDRQIAGGGNRDVPCVV